MIYTNQLMLKYYCENKEFNKFNYVLESGLKSILYDGFIIIGDCIFLDKVLHKDF